MVQPPQDCILENVKKRIAYPEGMGSVPLGISTTTNTNREETRNKMSVKSFLPQTANLNSATPDKCKSKLSFTSKTQLERHTEKTAEFVTNQPQQFIRDTCNLANPVDNRDPGALGVHNSQQITISLKVHGKQDDIQEFHASKDILPTTSPNG